MGRATLLIFGGALLLLALPLRGAWLTGEVPGAGPDVISTLWGFWWFQARAGVAGGWTELVNYPNGAFGAVLSPSSAIGWSLAEPLLGAGRAMAWVASLQLAAFVAATATLCQRLSGNAVAAALGAGALLVSRYLLHGLGEGSLVAVTALPLPLGLLALMEAQEGDRKAALALALLMPALAWENPYLGPVLPGLVALALLQALAGRSPGRGPLAAALFGGALGVLAVGAHFSSAASPDYPSEVAATVMQIGPVSLPIIDLPWSRATPAGLVWPGPVRWTEAIDGARSEGGGRYLGLTVLLLAGLGLWRGGREARPWGLLAAFCLLLSMGSVIGGLPGPFLFVNHALDLLARPFTQPTRFLAVALVALAALAALGARSLPPRLQAAAGALLLGEALAVGGLSLRLPTLALPEAPCLADLPDEEGGLVLFPGDVGEGDAGPAQLLQLVHGRPAAHRGIASWRLHGARVTDRLRQAGLDPRQTGAPDGAAIGRLGMRWLVVQGPVPARFSRLGPPTETCGDYTLFTLPR